jgi:adenosylcobinamide kinase/adenosylcobinamide-phosphate guanylyltransferase
VITFVTGGSRSGKSSFAERLVFESAPGRVVYIASAEAGDAEMASRIASHKARRPAEWSTWEGGAENLPREIGNLASEFDALLFDSLTAYISGAFAALSESSLKDEKLWAETEEILLSGVRAIFSGFRAAAEGTDKRLIIVSDETGCGVVPPSLTGRRFRDVLGSANQIAAGAADFAALVVAGIPIWIKRPA